MAAKVGAFFGGNRRHKDKALLLDLIKVNPCVSTNLANAARHRRRSRAEYRGSFPFTYPLLHLAMSTY